MSGQNIVPISASSPGQARYALRMARVWHAYGGISFRADEEISSEISWEDFSGETSRAGGAR